MNIQDHVLLPIYDLYTFHLVCSSGGLNVTVHIHLLLGHQPTIINVPLRAFHIFLFHHLSVFGVVAIEGNRERNRTSPNQWIPFSILSIDIETHDAFTISDTLSCRSSEAGFAISPHSLPIVYQKPTQMSSFFQLYFHFLYYLI